MVEILLEIRVPSEILYLLFLLETYQAGIRVQDGEGILEGND